MKIGMTQFDGGGGGIAVQILPLSHLLAFIDFKIFAAVAQTSLRDSAGRKQARNAWGAIGQKDVTGPGGAFARLKMLC